MSTTTALKIVFSCVFFALLVCTTWAGAHQAAWRWTGLTVGIDRYWTIATLMDAYFGFLTFYVWVFYKETHWPQRTIWFIAIMLLGNMAMSAYVLLQLYKLKSAQAPSDILTTRNR
jgi:Protein of unknown function (DUF1475)